MLGMDHALKTIIILSVGIEDGSDLVKDLRSGLDAVQGSLEKSSLYFIS